jgi:hypothetical protein
LKSFTVLNGADHSKFVSEVAVDHTNCLFTKVEREAAETTVASFLELATEITPDAADKASAPDNNE